MEHQAARARAVLCGGRSRVSPRSTRARWCRPRSWDASTARCWKRSRRGASASSTSASRSRRGARSPSRCAAGPPPASAQRTGGVSAAPSMRAAVFDGAGRIAPADWPRPAVGAGELLLRCVAAGCVAPTSPRSWRHRHAGRRRCSATRWSATWSRPGAGVRRVRRRAIAWWRHTTCRAASATTAGAAASRCAASFKISNLDPGGFAEYVRVPAPNVRHATFRIPDHLGDEEASFVEPLACCLRAVRPGPRGAGRHRGRDRPGLDRLSVRPAAQARRRRRGRCRSGRRACGPGAGPRRRRDRRCRERGAGRARAERGTGSRPRHRDGGRRRRAAVGDGRRPGRRCRPLFRGRSRGHAAAVARHAVPPRADRDLDVLVVTRHAGARVLAPGRRQGGGRRG